MAVTDNVVMIGIILMINLLTIYRLNKLAGSLIFLLIGIVTLAVNSLAIDASIGFIILFMGIIMVIYSMIPNKKK